MLHGKGLKLGLWLWLRLGFGLVHRLLASNNVTDTPEVIGAACTFFLFPFAYNKYLHKRNFTPTKKRKTNEVGRNELITSLSYI